MPQLLEASSGRVTESADFSRRSLALLAGLTIFGFLVLGYHPGLEDDAFYLAAVERHVDPALFPHDADYFRVHFQATIFDKLVAASVRLTHLSVAWSELLWQIAAIFLVLLGCWRIARRCFRTAEAQWAAVTLIAVLLSMPLPGVALLLGDQYLHPRMLATAAILAAVVAVLDRRNWRAVFWLAVAFTIHAIMACFGISFCLFLWWAVRSKANSPSLAVPALIFFPLGWLFEPASDAWRQAAATRGFYFLGRWHWYEWLGVFAPLALLLAIRSFLKRPNDARTGPAFVPLVSALLYFGVFQTIVGIAISLPPSLERLRPFEPMRYLHLVYLVFFLVAGGLIGNYVLDRRAYRWLLLFVSLGAGMFYAQRRLYAASPHLELPFLSPGNDWLRAFDWIRWNTPVDSQFAIDPHYQTLPGEDSHGFRALAERSVLADYEKDGGMAARVPRLAPRWLAEVSARNGWRSFDAQDFERLKRDFGVNWVVLSRADRTFPMPDPQVMICPYVSRDVKVCHLL